MRRLFNSFRLIFLVVIVPLSLTGCSGGSGSADPGNFCDQLTSACYDIIYVRYPIAETDGKRVALPAGENPYVLEPGGDLMLLKQDGSEKVLVDCTGCTVMDPYISYDGKTVYYSYNEKVMNSPYGDEFASWIYKIHLEGHPDFNNHEPIRLTFDDGYDSVLYKANQDASGNIKSADHDQSKFRAIRDMAPVPLADGRLLFTSNRSALTTFHPRTNAIIKGSIQQMYVMDDHDGAAVTKELANIQRLETGNIHLVQHPMQLKDGRLLFSTWQDVAAKQGKLQYAQMPLFTVHPDGSNLQQFTEPHDHKKNVEHFVTQLSDGQVVWGRYYPLQEGYGIIMRAPVSSDGPDFLRGSIDQRYTAGNQYKISYREFDRKGTVTITPHTNPGDAPAYDLSGKYSMPSAAVGGGLLVSYSTGSVNQTVNFCGPSECESLKSGIYLMPYASGDESTFITDPVKQLIKIKDDPNYNEIWPRAVLSYGDIYGVSKPNLLNDITRSGPEDSRLLAGEAKAILGTSSIYNREPLNEADPDPFISMISREQTDGNWTVEGAEAGVFSNDDIYGVRIIATPPKPYTKPINVFTDKTRWDGISRHLQDTRLQHVVARYGSAHGERWEILGEFPVKKPSVTDGQGNPDTSWMAKIPADTPTLIQTIDKNGMTLVSELTWRALKSGEKRVDCGGCHAHSVEPLDFATTEAGKGKPIVNISGVNSTGPEVKDGVWNLTLNKIPLLNETGVTFKPGYSYGVEFNRDIIPILNNRCVGCHQAGQSGQKLVLNDDPWSKLSETDADAFKYNAVQVSRYIRMPQARQSLLVWAAWGERLDGRENADRGDDIDYPLTHPSPAVTGITEEEKRSIARWVDLGSPIDFPQTDGVGYTDDYQLPIINIYTPHSGDNTGAQLKVGFNDAKSGLDWDTLEVKYYEIGSTAQAITIDVASDVDANDILTKNLGLGAGEYVVSISVKDKVGNTGVASRRFKIN